MIKKTQISMRRLERQTLPAGTGRRVWFVDSF